MPIFLFRRHQVLPTWGVMNGPSKFLTARKILPSLDLLAKFKRVLACSGSPNFRVARKLAKQIFYFCSCSQKNRSARHARECSQRPFVTPDFRLSNQCKVVVNWYDSLTWWINLLDRPTSTKGMGCIMVGSQSFYRLRRFYGKNKASKLPYTPPQTQCKASLSTLCMGYGCAHV